MLQYFQSNHVSPRTVTPILDSARFYYPQSLSAVKGRISPLQCRQSHKSFGMRNQHSEQNLVSSKAFKARGAASGLVDSRNQVNPSCSKQQMGFLALSRPRNGIQIETTVLIMNLFVTPSIVPTCRKQNYVKWTGLLLLYLRSSIPKKIEDGSCSVLRKFQPK